jgi:hypothetical protein
MLLMDMSQYQGDDREQVIAGYNIARAWQLGAGTDAENSETPGFRRICTAALMVYQESPDEFVVKYLAAPYWLGTPCMNEVQAVSVLAYLKAHIRTKRVIARLNGIPDRHDPI